MSKGPFHVFLGGSPQSPGDKVLPGSLSLYRNENGNERDQTAGEPYLLTVDATESERRVALANWITDSDNPLTLRVLANRIWHYHFGTGIVSTPSDFGLMGGKPSHPQLLDFLASALRDHRWRIKPIHRMIVLSETYRQSSLFDPPSAAIDRDSRLLWRFPPRRISAEEVRDTMLQVSGVWKRDSILEIDSDTEANAVNLPDGGPGFRLYKYLQDNVSTYIPLDHHGSETYRRAVYHQNARSSVVDLMTEFDQPDCAFSTPRRSSTTTPLQALTMLNHSFGLDMADALAKRLQIAAKETPQQIELAFELCYGRVASKEETSTCAELIDKHGLAAFCRALLNTSELIYLQ